jgi:aldehyde:ferredoxin oxidoreductase
MSFAGTILRIDLERERVDTEPTSKYVSSLFGGALLGSFIFTSEVAPQTRPFDPSNVLMFNTGPLTGTLFGNKGEFASKTPERTNNPYVRVGMGGQFPSELKFAGYDHLIIRGKAVRPVYISIENERVELRDAAHLWGLDVWETQARIKEEQGDPEVQVACIGPAGENLVVYALIMHDINNTASRKGLGAVMGSKNLKAIAVRGTRGLKIKEPEALLKAYERFFREITQGRAYAFARMLHTEGISRQIAEGYVYAYGADVPEEVPPSPMITFLKRYMVKPLGCAFCPIQCHQNFSVPEIGNGGANCVNYFGLIYGQLYGQRDLHTWWEKTLLSNRYGLDSLIIESIGGFLMELYEEGVIGPEDTEGIPMERGSRQAIRAIIEKVARREGFGSMFSSGIGPATETLARMKGVDPSVLLQLADQYDNQFPYGVVEYAPDIGPVSKYRVGEVERVPGFADAYGNIPAYAEILKIPPRKVKELLDEWASEASERITGDRELWRRPKYDPRYAKMVVYKENEFLLGDLTGHCEVKSAYLEHYGVKFSFEDYREWIRAATGRDYTAEQLFEFTHRLRVLTDAYNALCHMTIGETPYVGKPMERLASFPVPGRPTDKEELRRIQEDYCRLRGYDAETGIPTKEELERLGFGHLAEALYAG